MARGQIERTYSVQCIACTVKLQRAAHSVLDFEGALAVAGWSPVGKKWWVCPTCPGIAAAAALRRYYPNEQ